MFLRINRSNDSSQGHIDGSSEESRKDEDEEVWMMYGISLSVLLCAGARAQYPTNSIINIISAQASFGGGRRHTETSSCKRPAELGFCGPDFVEVGGGRYHEKSCEYTGCCDRGNVFPPIVAIMGFEDSHSADVKAGKGKLDNSRA